MNVQNKNSPQQNTASIESLQKISIGNQNAFKALFHQWQPRIYRYIWLRVRNVQIAEDLVQEVFFRLWQKRQHLPQSSNFTAFIFQIAHNLVVDWTRKNKVRSQAMATLGAKNEISPAANDQIEASELNQAVTAAISNLPPAMQNAFVLHRMENLTYKQIAEVMNISVKTVEKHISKALQRLRDIFRKQDFL
ncbi:RNA polymerase sigma-70 factor [candidate division KSB1 bacterium]|nr:RNA polymerase sigma-70 factor [candidate division KSB1 bacterium]